MTDAEEPSQTNNRDEYSQVARLFYGTFAVCVGVMGGIGAWLRSMGDPFWLRFLYVAGIGLLVLGVAWIMMVWPWALPRSLRGRSRNKVRD